MADPAEDARREARRGHGCQAIVGRTLARRSASYSSVDSAARRALVLYSEETRRCGETDRQGLNTPQGNVLYGKNWPVVPAILFDDIRMRGDDLNPPGSARHRGAWSGCAILPRQAQSGWGMLRRSLARRMRGTDRHAPQRLVPLTPSRVAVSRDAPRLSLHHSSAAFTCQRS